ncbi:hypothetical protein D8S78_05650 [Natrialba swarupiae]|nr:hypothetical protein [Natrialba swarupiae]
MRSKAFETVLVALKRGPTCPALGVDGPFVSSRGARPACRLSARISGVQPVRTMQFVDLTVEPGPAYQSELSRTLASSEAIVGRNCSRGE